ncbi:MAG: TonB-dependent receptor [Saprospiraceae bacterium]|nr:TonB-dependent receptor [Saprospiraceae bacterium]
MNSFKSILSGFFLSIIASISYSQQSLSLSGTINDEKGAGIPFATIILKSALDSSMVKADITSDSGVFTFERLKPGRYFAEASYIGMTNFTTEVFEMNDKPVKMVPIILTENAKQLEEVVVTATRSLVEVKADRTIFNVQGTINSAGENGLNLLRKAPGVLVDNNDNISVLGRAGVLIYVDGKRIPLTGDDLTNYLQNLSSEQIDKIDIITNPGSKYEAQGNAGIIDIRLKKDKNLGGNGSISGTFGQGKYAQGNTNANGNYRNKKLNTFGGIGYNKGTRWNNMLFDTYQNGIRLDESNISTSDYDGLNGRWGTDFFINKKSTLGFLIGAQSNTSNSVSNNITYISNQARPNQVDSILTAPNSSDAKRNQATFNINYAYESGKNRLNVDLDYGSFRNEANHNQPNIYFNATGTNIISQNKNTYNTPVKIDIATAKADFETEVLGGNLGIGTKFSNVVTDNTFLFYNIIQDIEIQNDKRSNQFKYNENVLAGYVNYSRSINAKWNASGGLRIENTDATGDLIAFLPELEESPVDFNYTSFFPSAGVTYQHSPEHVYSLNYGRRINRPDYNVLNPFREQLSELSYSKGNKFLQPEIVNNIELGYTLKYRYTFKLAYSNTSNQITRLIGPDELDPRAGFISWDNLATQKLYNFNVSLPFDVNKWWNVYMNLSASYIDNQADYGDNGIVDVQAGTYNVYQQHTFNLGKKWKAELSGWYGGPGVWGGVFLYDPSYSLNLGLQRKFLNDKMNVRLSANDVTFQSGWSGVAEFNGQKSFGQGNWDSRRASISISYDLGNSNVKSRKRSTGIENESKRVGG